MTARVRYVSQVLRTASTPASGLAMPAMTAATHLSLEPPLERAAQTTQNTPRPGNTSKLHPKIALTAKQTRPAVQATTAN